MTSVDKGNVEDEAHKRDECDRHGSVHYVEVKEEGNTADATKARCGEGEEAKVEEDVVAHLLCSRLMMFNEREHTRIVPRVNI